jgi:allantoin racemase
MDWEGRRGGMREMGRKILWINPVGTPVFDGEMLRLFEAERLPDTEVEVRSLERGPHHLEYHYYGALVLPDTLHLIKEAEREGFDAVVVGCFYDPGLKEAREVAEIPVIFPAEACLYLAATMGDKFSILVGRRKWIPAMRENVERYGLGSKLASFKELCMGVHDFQKDPDKTRRRMLMLGREAVEQDGAEVLILGCTIEFGFFRDLQEELGVPVLDATVTPFKVAEFRADLKQRYGWSASKRGGYEAPPIEEIQAWGLPAQYPGLESAKKPIVNH